MASTVLRRSNVLPPLSLPLHAFFVKTYVVFVEKKLDVYERWEEAQAQVNGFRGASYKGYHIFTVKKMHLKAFDEYMEKHYVAASSTSTESSTSIANSSRKAKHNERIAKLVDVQADLAREHQKNALKMIEISEELKRILESMKFSDDV